MPNYQYRPLAARWFVQDTRSGAVLARCYSVEHGERVRDALNHCHACAGYRAKFYPPPNT